MSRPIITIHNTETNEIIEREMNDAEFAQYKIDQANAEAEKAKEEEKESAKAQAESKLAKLGLTTDDLRALGL